MVVGGMHGCWGACVVARGHAWVLGGMCCFWGGGEHAWLSGGCMVVGGHAWLGACMVVWGTCVVAGRGMRGCQGVCSCGGMHGCGGCVVVEGVWL